jgi:hypothetical protein
MREWYARRRRRGQSRGDAVHHFVFDTGAPQCVGFFSAAPEDERIAALQSHDGESGSSFGNKQALDEGLWRRLAAAAFAYSDYARAFTYVNEDGAIHELVNEHNVRET